MDTEPEALSAVTPGMGDCRKAVAPSAEKVISSPTPMDDRDKKIIQLEARVRELEEKQYDTAIVIENLKICLSRCLGINPDDNRADITRKTEWLQAMRAKFEESVREERDVAPENIATSSPTLDQIDYPKIQNSLEVVSEIESCATGVAAPKFSAPSIDYNTTLRLLLTVASLKKMTVKHFYKEWNNGISNCLQKNEFKRSFTDPYLYVKSNGESVIYWTPYSNDFLVAAANINLINEIASFLEKFNVRDFGTLCYFQGMEIRQNEDGIYHINQSKFIDKILIRFGLTQAALSGIPLNKGHLLARQNRQNQQPMRDNLQYQELMTCLSHLAMTSRPDIAVSVTILSQYNEAPTQSDWVEAKRIMRYLKGTADFELRLGKNTEVVGLIGYADANWNKGQPSFSGYVFHFYGSPVSWASQKQLTIVNSTPEAEYMALEEATRKGLWLESLLHDLKSKDERISITMYEDSQKCLDLVNSDEFIKCSSDSFDLTFDMSDISREKIMIFRYCQTTEMLADMMTKPLLKNKLKELAEKTGLKNFSIL